MYALGIVRCLWITPYFYGVTSVTWVVMGACGITCGVHDNRSSLPRRLSGLRRSRVHSLMIARRSLCPEKLGSNPGQGSKGINFSGWHGLDMSITVTKRR